MVVENDCAPIMALRWRAWKAGSPFVFKRLGERVMSRTFERQVNELHIRAAILNRFTEIGCPQTAVVA